jgi:long-subunit acyl-CoA synthetase (AMP-forming)
MGKTVMEAMEATAQKWGSRPALKHKDKGEWKTRTWKEYRDEVRLTARAFMALGLSAGSAVAIIGKNCPQWAIADIAAIYAGAVPAGIYTTNSAEQCHYIAEHAEATIAVVEDQEQLAKFKKIRNQLPKLKAIVLMTGSEPDAHAWSDLPKLAEKVKEEELEQRIKNQKADDLCTLIYTSGTTGNPKGVMITHDNLTWTTQQVIDIVKVTEKDRMISYLPFSHIAEQVVSLHAPLNAGAECWFAEGIEQLGDNLREVHPTIFLGVPRVWEKIQAKMVAAGSQNPPLKKKIAAWARKKGLAAGYAEQDKKGKPAFFGLANKLVFSKVRDKLGLDQCRFQATAAAPISKDTLEFFLSLNIPIYEIYGMSECTGPATVSIPGRYRTAKAGFCIPNGEIKIASDGEILMRGRHVCKGYFKNPEATKEAIDSEGWLHSGDIGEINEEGFLQITDRKKDLIITAGGENIAPQVLEGLLKSIPVVGQVVVIGDKQKFMTALFTLNPEKLSSELKAAGSPATDAVSAAKCEKFLAHFQKQLDAVNEKLARVQSIRKFTFVPEFTIEGGELTPTMKIKRKVVNQKYSREISQMYA